MSAVPKTIWFIESYFPDGALSLEQMAEHAGVSRSHLSRLFPVVTGRSISGYLRGRRLTEGARLLAAGAPDILRVALDVGYGSHEAFTRAFRDHFGLTPEEVRRRRSLDTLELVEPLDMTPQQKITLAPPVIETREAQRLAGLSQRYDFTTRDTIPQQWQRFDPFFTELLPHTGGLSYGVCGAYDERDGGFDYFSAVPLPKGVEALPGMTEMTLPAGRYVRFRHEGHISGIRNTCAAVYETGMPALGEEPDTRWFSILEYYGADFDPATGMGTVEVWLKLKD